MPADAYVYEGSDLLRLGEQLKNYNAATADLIVEHIGPGDRVLDFGAGFGTLTKAVAARTKQPQCVEPDRQQRERLIRDGFHCFDSIESVESHAYDVVYSSNVLEHIEDDVRALKEIHRVLTPGGKVVLYLPAFQSLYTALDRAIGHYRRYDIKMIETRLREAGFETKQSFYVDVLGYPVSKLFKAISDDVSTVNTRTIRIYDSVVFPISRLIEKFVRPPFGKNVLAFAVSAKNPEIRASG